MPTPSVEEIEVNEALKKEVGVIRFYKQGDVLNLAIGENTLLQFDVAKGIQKTKQNLEDAADDIDFDKGILAKLKHILARDYAEFLKLQEPSNKDSQAETTENSDVKKINVFKYSTDIPLAEQIKLNRDYFSTNS